MNLYRYVGNNSVNYVDPSGLEVYVCGRPADLAYPINQFNHEWILTDTIEAGMGERPGVIPGQGGDSALPYSSVQVVDHTGQFDAANSHCEYQPQADEECVNAELEIGRDLGRWSPTNNCQTFVNQVINKCNRR